jgi:hypothetical protein
LREADEVVDREACREGGLAFEGGVGEVEAEREEGGGEECGVKEGAEEQALHKESFT